MMRQETTCPENRVRLTDPTVLYQGEPTTFTTIDGDRGLKAFDVCRVEPRLKGTVEKWERGFGFILPDDGGPRVFVHQTAILGAGFRSLAPDEAVEFALVTGDKGPQAVRVTRTQSGVQVAFAPGRTLENFAWLGDFGGRIDELAQIAIDEDWAYRHTASIQGHPVLRNYVLYTFERLFEEEKISYATDDAGVQIAAFNTGLVTPRQEEIFGFLAENKSATGESRKWSLQGFFRESDRRLSHFSKPAELADYFEDPSELLYDARINLVVDMEHVIGDNKDRFPAALRENDFALQGVLNGAIAAARKRVRRNYKTAIPQFFRGRLQLLLPLCLTNPETADLALVVSRENQVYRASTVLTLDMAYNNARLIARPDREWLEP